MKKSLLAGAMLWALPALSLPTLVSSCRCAEATPAFVAVPEEDLVMEAALPLTPEYRAVDLPNFLEAGGDRKRMRSELVIPDAKARYGPLLQLLGDSEKKPTLQSIASDAPYRQWFKRPPVHQVVNAKAKRPPKGPERPDAYSDGKFWWVFYPHPDGTLLRVMVFMDWQRKPDE